MNVRHGSLWVISFTAILVMVVAAQDVGVLSRMAQEEISAKNWTVAEQHLQAILAKDAASAEAHHLMSIVALNRDNLKGAQQSIASALELDSRNEEFRAQADKIADLSRAMGQARRFYDERSYDDAVTQYERIIEDYPTFASAYYSMGLAFKMAGNLRKAAEAFRKATGHNSDDARYAMALRKLVADKYNEGNRLYKSRDYDGAAEAYQEAYGLDPGFYQAYYRLARSLKNLGDIDGALEALDHCLLIYPAYITAYVEKGNILRREGEDGAAEEVYRQALAVDPKADNAWVGLGAVLRADRTEEAVAAFETAIAVNPKNASANEYLGELYSEQEKWPEALSHLELAAKLRPKRHTTAWRLAVVYNQLGEHEKARLSAKRSTDINKNFEYAWYQKGIAEKALGNRLAAIEAFKNAERGRDAGIRRTARYELSLLESPNR